MTDLLDATADLLLGATCPGCGAPGRRLCSDCTRELLAGDIRPRRRDVLPDLAVWSAGDYGGLPQRLINAAKERRRWDVVDVLGQRLAAAVAGLLAAVSYRGPISLVPIPSSRAAIRRRGFDFGARLAVAAQTRLTWAGVDTRTCALLEQRRPVADQSGLAWAERLANLDHAYDVRLWRRSPTPPRPCVVVDDVVTTGASLGEAQRVLQAAGADLLGAATVAATLDRPCAHSVTQGSVSQHRCNAPIPVA
jgi:predicted amidophosphoribosyltransferase